MKTAKKIAECLLLGLGFWFIVGTYLILNVW